MTLVRSFEEDLHRAVEFHGHLCGGQIIGTRISRAALEYFGIDDADSYKDLIAFVEADRCLADAITIVSGCHLGKKRLKWFDYGKMAASFLDLKNHKAIRITTASDKRAPSGCPPEEMIAFYQAIPDQELVFIQQVDIPVTQYDLPGKPLRSVACAVCGERIHDNRDLVIDDLILCKPCAGEDSYYKLKPE